jgi:hypothetical protein
MKKNNRFEYNKSLINIYVKSEYEKKFRRNSRISIRKRHKFMDDMTRKISKKFGKDVMCLIDFAKGGFATLLSPAHTESTDLGTLYKSFSHPQIVYTSHCLRRFSERADSDDNCIIIMDSYINDALLTYGENPGHLTCPCGVFAYVINDQRMIVKTYINFDLLSEEQINKFYGSGTATVISKEFISENFEQSDFKLLDENIDHLD